MFDHSGTSVDDPKTDLNLSNEEEDDDYVFFIVKLKNDLSIFERRQPISTVDDSSLIEDIYFRYDKDGLRKSKIRLTIYMMEFVNDIAESEEKYPETHSKKYFFLPQKYMKEGNEAEVSELYTNLALKMKLEKPVTVVQVEPADYKAAFEHDPNLVWFAGEGHNIINHLAPVICMFSGKDQMDQFYAALVERNRDHFMNGDPDYLSQFVKAIVTTAKERAKGDSFRDQHIEALCAALLHVLKTSSYIPGKAQKTQEWAKYNIQRWIDNMFNSHYDTNHSHLPAVFEELQANLFHLHLTRLVYQNYFANVHSEYRPLQKPAYWNPSYFGWVVYEVIEAKLRNKTIGWSLDSVFMADIFQQPCFRRFLKDEPLRKIFGNVILDDFPLIIKDNRSYYDNYMKSFPIMNILFRGNYEDLEWDEYLADSTLGFYVEHLQILFEYSPQRGISVMDTINITTAMLAMYPEEKGERRKETANYLLKYMDQFFVLGRLRKECIISEEKETDNFKEMQEILATCFRLPDVSPYAVYAPFEPEITPISDVSSELPLDRIYELYCQSNEQVNPSAGLLWLGIAHRQAIGSLGELSEEQQTNCFEMLASALDDLPLQTIETFFNSIQGFTTRKTVATDVPEDKTPQDVDNMTAELGKTLEQTRAERIEKRITAYIAQRKEEETAVLFLLNSEIGIEEVNVNENSWRRYKKEHTTSAGIFVFMTLFEYNDEILEGTAFHRKKTFDYYVLTFTKYLINNAKVKDIFYKKNQLRYSVREHIRGCLKTNYDHYEQLNDLFRLDWQTYYNKWMAEKPVIGKFDLNLIHDKIEIGYGKYGSAHICRYSDFVIPIVYKEFSNASAFHSIVRELNSLMKVQSHPHVVRIFGVATDQNNVATGLMMEYCEGGSLDKLLAKKGYMYDGKKTVHWMAQATSALIFFQKIEVVHLDIKPANMLLCKDHHYLKIADMGITLLTEIQNKIKLESSISNSRNDNFPLTASREGTYGFMAPEVMGSEEGNMVCSYASDIFSLGRTLWSIYYKENPWDELVNETVIMPVLSKNIFTATDIPEDQTPQAVENITADMRKTLGLVKMKLRDDVKLECPERIAKWIIRMTRFDPGARPTADTLHKEFMKQYEEYERIEKEDALKEKDSILRVTPQSKLWFSAPIKDEQTANVEIANVSKTDNVQWVATCTDPDLKVNPNGGNLTPQEAVTVDVTCIKLKDTSMDNFTITWHRLPHGSSYETDDQQEYIKKLKIEYNF